ncbi:MAG: HAD family hydrolase [Hyphomicrobiaceae bacterium]
MVTKIRAILLDKDGTILDYARTWVPINRDVALYAAGGDAKLADHLLRLGGHDPVTNVVAAGSPLAAGSIDDIAGAFAAHLGARTPPRFAATIDQMFREGGTQHAVLIDGAFEAMRALSKAGYRLGIATNDSMGGLEASLGRHARLLAMCEFLAGCDSGHGAKPGPGMVHAFADKLGLAPSAIAVVGDAVHDLEMGARAGVGLRIAVLSGTSAEADLAPHADVVLPSIRELPGHLAR